MGRMRRPRGSGDEDHGSSTEMRVRACVGDSGAGRSAPVPPVFQDHHGERAMTALPPLKRIALALADIEQATKTWAECPSCFTKPSRPHSTHCAIVEMWRALDELAPKAPQEETTP